MPRSPDTADLTTIAFPALELAAPAAEQIETAMRAAILSAAIPPGALVSETEVALRFGASRTPVREAFTKLREAGLIVTRPSRGNYVTRLSETRLREAQFIREGLELASVARLCEIGLAPRHRQAIEASLAGQAAAILADDDLQFQAEDDRFHRAMAEATGFARVPQLLTQEKTPLDRLRVLALSDRGHKARLLSEHEAILTALDARAVAAAQEAMRHHLQSILQALTGLRAAHADYFE